MRGRVAAGPTILDTPRRWHCGTCALASYLTLDTMVVRGEEELGPQRECSDCGEWWPLSTEFWLARGHSKGYGRPGRPPKGAKPDPAKVGGVYYLQPCRACREEQGRPVG